METSLVLCVSVSACIMNQRVVDSVEVSEWVVDNVTIAERETAVSHHQLVINTAQ